MNVCMYVCMYVYMNECMHTCMHVYACVYVCMYVSMYVCMYICKLTFAGEFTSLLIWPYPAAPIKSKVPTNILMCAISQIK